MSEQVMKDEEVIAEQDVTLDSKIEDSEETLYRLAFTFCFC